MAAVVAVIIGFLLSRYAKARAKLVYSFGHASTLWVDQPVRDAQGNVVAPRQMIATASINVLNGGSETAKNVEVVFASEPMFLNVYPERHHEIRNVGHSHSRVFSSLAPKEQISFEIVSFNQPLPGVLTVRSDEVTARQQRMAFQPVHPRWAALLALWFMSAGFAATGWVTVYLVQFVAGR